MPTLLVPRVLPGLPAKLYEKPLRTLGTGLALIVALTWAPAVQAQDTTTDFTAPAHVAYLDGMVTLERDGTLESASVNVPIVAGDRLRTTLGRLELLFPDGSALDLDENSSMDVLSPTLVRLVAGRASMIVAGVGDPSAAVRYQIDTPVASVRTDGPGEFRVAVLSSRDGETELAVVRGLASLATERGEIGVRAGERTVAFENGAPSFPQTFNSARFDAFDRWVGERRDARMTASSAQYLPRELQTYGGTLDRYGSWQNEAPYGYVWYPTVDASWRPYYYGNWSAVPSYGWTWIGADVWSWPTHHYGRWGHAGARWFWIPGRTWGPAWVSWAAAPGYVSWCPLGFDGRPVYGLSIGVGNRWAGWTVVPRGSFGFRDHYVNRYAIQPHLLPRTTPFIVQSVAPVAVPRFARGQPASVDLGRRARANEGAAANGRRQTAVDGRRNAADNQAGDFTRRPGTADRGAVPGERAVPRPPGVDGRSPASSAEAQSRTGADRLFSPGRRQDSGSPASTRDFRLPLPDNGRPRAIDRGMPAAPRQAGGDAPAPQNAEPREPSRDPRRFSTGDLPSAGAGRRPGFGDASPQRPAGIGRVEGDGRARDNRVPTPDGARAPEFAAPRYGRPAVERQSPNAPPAPGTTQRSAPVDRGRPAPPESRGAPANSPSAPASAPPAARAERPAPGHAESHGERAVPRGEGSTRGASRR